MPLDKSFNLDAPEGITKDDINEMEEENRQIKELAISAEENIERILQAKKKLDNSGMDFATKNIMSGGVAVSGQSAPAIGMSQEDFVEAVRDALAQIEKLKEENKETKKKLTEEEQALKELKAYVNNIENKISSGAHEAMSFVGSPMNFGKNKIMGILGKAGIYGAIASFAVGLVESMYNQILGEIKDLFKDGGYLDPRKDILDEVREMIPQKDLIDIDRGNIIFATSSGVYQKAPDFSNTERKVHGHLKDIMRNAGE